MLGCAPSFAASKALAESWQNGYCTSLENWRPKGHGGSNPSLSATHSTANKIKLIDAAKDQRIKGALSLSIGENIDDQSEVVRLSSLMTAGDEIREKTKCYDFLGQWGISLISGKRDAQSPDNSNMKLGKTAHILHSIKHSDEVKLLR